MNFMRFSLLKSLEMKENPVLKRVIAVNYSVARSTAKNVVYILLERTYQQHIPIRYPLLLVKNRSILGL